jgi:hypothetical protein
MTDHDPIDDLLDGLRTDVPAMSDDAFEAGRARLQVVIAPQPVVTALEPDLPVTPSRRRRFLRSPPGKLTVAAAAVVVLTAGALLVQTMRPGSPAPVGKGPDVAIPTAPADGPAPIASAAAQLNAAADRVTPGPADSIGPGQYRYLATRSWYLLSTTDPRTVYLGPDRKRSLPPLAFFAETIGQVWVPADAPDSMCWVQNTKTDKEKWVIGDEQAARAAGWDVVDDQNYPMDDQRCYFYDGGNGLWGDQAAPQFLAALPRDPAQLYDRLRTDDLSRFSFDGDRDEAMVGAVGDTLRGGMTPPDLRAALLRALAMTPDLQVTQQVAEVDGRTGTAFGVSRNGEIFDLVIDTTTGELIAQRTIDEDGDYHGVPLPPRTIVYYRSAAKPVVVDRVGATG